ncbi:MAG TPA: CpaF family protein [Anaeromyxobacteraceae bacterium]|jgi:pilus assembly protein CpaF|nr:CpaF family protein [Anaeromyxobacteraceae bacterium]
MALSERLRRGTDASAATSDPETLTEAFLVLKGELHRRLVDKLDLQTLQALPPERLREELRAALAGVVASARASLNHLERERMVQELLDELTGLGPLEPLLRDGTISDILVNTYSSVYIERAGKLEPTRIRFDDNDHLMRVIGRIVSRVGRRVDETSPMVDARLPDGSRVNAIIPPLAIDGPILSIRRFGTAGIRARDLIDIGSCTPAAMGFLGATVRAKLNVLISGGTGTGKTTLLNALSAFIPESERIVTIEDSAELKLQQQHVVRLETRPPNIEGKGEITTRDLVRNSLRMRPDRIVVGEVRAEEVLDMLQAMNTGHEGSMTTVHANATRDALARLEAMVGMSGVPLTEASVRQLISRALNVIVQLSRGSDGRRRVTSVAEITGTEGAVITMQEIYRFDQRGVDAQGQILGALVPTGIRPRVLERIERAAVDPARIAAEIMETP